MKGVSAGEADVKSARSDGPIIFYDGICGLCNGFVNFMLAHDVSHRYRFATLQGRTASDRLPKSSQPVRDGADPLQSMVLLDQNGVHRMSDSVLRALEGLGGVWFLVGALRLVPAPIRNAIYGYIARNRYKWFGTVDTCRLPSAAETESFLP